MIRISFAAILAIAACGHAAPAHDDHAPPPGDDDASCPLVVSGTSVTVEDTDKGAAFVFVTTGDLVKMRERAHFLAASLSLAADGGKKPDHAAFAAMIATPARAVKTDIEHGARVELTPSKPADVAALQSELRMHAQHLSAGSCKMAM
jgi:hypothetical protein